MSVRNSQPEDRRHPCAPIRALILSDVALLREGLLRAVASDPSIAVVDPFGKADVVVLDAAAAERIDLARLDGAAVVVVAAQDDDEWALRALEKGVRGIVLRSEPVSHIVAAIHAVRAGTIWARRSVISLWVDELLSRLANHSGPVEETLSSRESKVRRRRPAKSRPTPVP